MLPVLAALGWMWRNNAVHGKPVFSTASGLNLLLSFNENASINHKFDYPLPERILKRLQNADSKEEYETIARDEAFGFIKSNPGKAARLTIFKQLDLWNPFSHASRGGFAQKEFKLLAAIPYIFFLTLGIIGFFKNRNSDFVIALLFLTLLNCLLNGIIAGSVRYRIITDFAFLLLAADMITRFWMYLRIKKHFPAK
jgi:hypothetical protein